MTVTKLTIEIDDGEPVVIIDGTEKDRWKARLATRRGWAATSRPGRSPSGSLGRWLDEAASDRAEPRTTASDFQVAPPNTRLQQATTGPEGHTSSHHVLGGTVECYEWNAERRQLTVGFTGGARITFSFVADQERVR